MVVVYDLDVPLARDPVIVVTVFGTVATIMTGLRVYALRLRHIPIGLPEYTIFGALFIVYVFIAIQYILSILGGAGRHASEVAPESVVITLKTILPLEALYGIVMSLVKTSIMLFYFRIFGKKKSFRISTFTVMTIVWLWAISVVLETFLLCRPLEYNWNTTIDGVCGERNATYVVAGTLNLVTDLMVMALPIPHIWKLQLSIPKKLALSLIFCMGLLVSIISVVRLASLMAIDFTDITHSVQMGVLWTVLEPELAVICANMPVLRPVVSKVFPRLFPASSNKLSHGVSNPQTFERLEEHPFYPLGEVARDHRAEISTGSDDSSHQKKNQHSTPITRRSVDEESSESDQILAKNAGPPGITVTQDFNLHY